MAQNNAPTITNLTLTEADTEYELALPAVCLGFSFQARQNAAVRFAFATGKVAGSIAPFATLKAGASYDSQAGTVQRGQSVYLASSSGGTIIELIAWG